jgi:hypothetical protein
MAEMLSQFSDVQLTEVYRNTTLEIICAARAETASPPASTLRVQRLFRSPYLLIEAVADFNRRHAAACIEKRKAIPAAECGDPWQASGERQLEAAVSSAVRSITRLVVERWNVPHHNAAILADIAACELRQWIREEYEVGRDAHCLAIASLHGTQMASARASDSPSTTNAPRPAGNRSRGLTTPERLEQWWSDPEKKMRLLAARGAKGVGLLIGRSKTQVIKAGRIWDEVIRPELAARRSLASYHRNEGRLRH